MKFCVLFSIIFGVAFGGYTKPGEITADNLESFATLNKITAGTALKKGQFLDFCYISVNFFQKQQTCGCFIYNEQFVATTARCVVDCSEKLASNVTVTFPQKSGKDAVVAVKEIFVYNGYDAIDDIAEFQTENMAMLKLSKPVKLDKKTAVKAELPTLYETFSEVLKDIPSTAKFYACGIGFINNNEQKPKGVLCTEVNVIDPVTGNCKEPGGTTPYKPADGIFCVQSTQSENNLCGGDFGGPIYATSISADGKTFKYSIIGMAIGSPDIRPSSPCLGGHTVFAQGLRGDELSFALYINDGFGKKGVVENQQINKKWLKFATDKAATV